MAWRSEVSARCATSFPTCRVAAADPIPRPCVTLPCARRSRRHDGSRRPFRIIAGGKSFGGRMTSQAQASNPLPGVRGLVFLGFPLHPPKEPSATRAAHLARIEIPMLFLQGTRDEFATQAHLMPVIESLGTRARLELFTGRGSFLSRAGAQRPHRRPGQERDARRDRGIQQGAVRAPTRETSAAPRDASQEPARIIPKAATPPAPKCSWRSPIPRSEATAGLT